MRISNLTSLCSQIESTAAPSLLAIAVTLTVIKDTRTSERPGQGSYSAPLSYSFFMSNLTILCCQYIAIVDTTGTAAAL